METNTLTIGALSFVASKKALVESLFVPINGKSAAGTYRKRANGVQFYNGAGEPWFFLVANRFNERFLVSTSKQSDGRTVYFSALSSKDESAIGLSFRELSETASGLWSLLTEEHCMANSSGLING